MAVAARNLEDAEKFAEKHSIPAVYGSYEELSEDAAVGPSASSLIGCWLSRDIISTQPRLYMS